VKAFNFKSIEELCPNSHKDFLIFYQEEFGQIQFLKNVPFDTIPFELQLGIFLKYFTKNGIDLDICNTEYSLLPEMITDTFKNFEKVIGHFS
jgi:hypothetical protein